MHRLMMIVAMLAVSASLGAWAATAMGEDARVTITPASPKQGDTLTVTLQPGREIAGATCRWLGKDYAFQMAGNVLRLRLPIGPDAATGKQTLRITVGHADGTRERIDRPVTIAAVNFGTQRLRLSAQTASLYSDPGVEREYQLIGAALRRVTAPRGWETRFVVPVVGRTSTTFALQRVTNGKSAGRHKGVDIAAPQGRRINAAQDGEVVLAEDFNMHGRTIIIDHGEGVCSLYLHCAEIWVQPGQQVRQGDAIGSVGSTGVATGPHLHWGVYIYGTAVSPMFWTK